MLLLTEAMLFFLNTPLDTTRLNAKNTLAGRIKNWSSVVNSSNMKKDHSQASSAVSLSRPCVLSSAMKTAVNSDEVVQMDLLGTEESMGAFDDKKQDDSAERNALFTATELVVSRSILIIAVSTYNILQAQHPPCHDSKCRR